LVFELRSFENATFGRKVLPLRRPVHSDDYLGASHERMIRRRARRLVEWRAPKKSDSPTHYPGCVAAFPAMMERDRKREGLRVCRAAWLLGVNVREYRELEAGERFPDSVTWERICKLYGWPR
jgi:hypothetical protein